MKLDFVSLNEKQMRVYTLHTAVIGSGAAGLNAAVKLHDYGQADTAVFTEGIRKGTSRNTGSDKQTYYKISLAGSTPDSPRALAEALFSGGCMDGDIALAEAAMSAECFFHLCAIGVPFPHNEYGEYAGYQTDHDTASRATSAGPLTSRIMHEKLLKEVQARKIPVFDQIQLVRLLVKEDRVIGFIGLDLKEKKDEGRKFILVNCTNIIYATGGPAGLYQASVYPPSQTGAAGTAFEAGAMGKNLTEWQYGIASLGFRWNLSGTYQQVLPRYLSTDINGEDERDFLAEGFKTPEALLEAIFLKGYQWPFDPRKIAGNGSSLIDLLVYHETVVKKRRVFLDYRRNPAQLERGGEACFEEAGETAYTYLKRSGALQGTPVERLIAMNPPAYELYASHGIDLKTQLLEIGVCAQHNNGGLAGDSQWESNLRHLFPIGEANGTHGVARPGGSALNSGQAGGLQAARAISSKYKEAPLELEEFLRESESDIKSFLEICSRLCSNQGKSNSVRQRKLLQKRMTEAGALVRDLKKIQEAASQAKAQLEQFESESVLGSREELGYVLKTRELLIAQYVYLTAMEDYIVHGGKSRGSFLVTETEGEIEECGLRFSLDQGERDREIQEVCYRKGDCSCSYRPVRAIPDADIWFERVWGNYRNTFLSR